MSVREYIGARYVPLFSDPLEWSNDKTYEPLTIVLHQGASYTSRQFVPKGIEITNENFWALTGNYNAQVEQYRQTVRTFDQRITDNGTLISTESLNLNNKINEEKNNREEAINNVNTSLQEEITARTQAIDSVNTSLQEEITARTQAIDTVNTSLQEEITARTQAIDTVNTSLQEEITNRNNSDSNFTARINLLESKEIFVIVGDSWVEKNSQYSTWTDTFKDAINEDIKVFGYGGTGWNLSNGNNTDKGNFTNQINYAYDTLTENERKRVKGVIAIGGVNDYSKAGYNFNTAYTAIHEGIINASAASKGKFPNAIFYTGINVQSYSYQSNATKCANMHCIAKRLQFTQDLQNKTIFLKNTNFAPIITGYAFTPEGLHLTQKGNASYGNAIAEAVSGGYNAVNAKNANASLHTGNLTTDIICSFNNGIVTLCMGVITGSDTSGTITIPDSGWDWMTDVLRIKNTNLVVGGVTDGNKNYGFWNYTTGNTSATINFSLPANNTCYSLPIVFPMNQNETII